MSRPRFVFAVLLGLCVLAGAGSAFAEGIDRPFSSTEDARFVKRRAALVQYLTTRKARAIPDERIIRAIGAIPRQKYMLEQDAENAYANMWYRIGYGQTITDPHMVAFMTHLLAIQATDKVLEIGTGSGYQASVLSYLTDNVYSVEVVGPLSRRTQELLKNLGLDRKIRTSIADGYNGWKENAPFDKIIVTCASDHIPLPLVQQLRPGGRMIIPVGPAYQRGMLYLLEKATDGRVSKRAVGQADFIPMRRRVQP